MSGIVVGVDGSAGSARALEWAMKTAAAMDLPLKVLAVHTVLRGQWSETAVVYPEGKDALDEVRRGTDQMVHQAAEQVPVHPSSVTIKVLDGLPVPELLDASKEADLVVVGSRGHGGFARLLMGSVSTQVVNHSACPVAVIPAGR